MTHTTADLTHIQNGHYGTEHPEVPYQQAGYGVNYGYAVHPSYSQHTWEPVYLQAQSPSAYSFPPSASAPSTSGAPHVPAVPIYAPVPLSPFSTLVSPISPLSQAASDSVTAPQATSRQPTPAEVPVSPASPTTASSNQSVSAPVTAEQSPLEYYGNAPQVMFPTPSELLTELNARGASGFTGEPSRKAAKVKNGSQAPASPAAPAPKPQTETQRKAYFRRVAEAVGFPPTDPDTITSHDKKRSYLECLEQYVQWLHEQIRLVGREPMPLERVQQYRGPSSRSIRTLLVHMQDEVRELHQQTLEDERDYMDLQAQLQMQRASVAAQQMRRHSVAACGLPDASLPPAPFLQAYQSHGAQGQHPQY
ncbi:hypothetical protein FOMPIDRAFT_50721 [Fomitopsis schrenkii]|uniref:Uncharacterized protein n=1 Tax=Fomitopsis schrenkii TaxID=2126942 RepID=S8EFT8_FOMSC|nr:hypothetical protein FOMPIDRAFT_50721 [Fomitopsis schrenkii]